MDRSALLLIIFVSVLSAVIFIIVQDWFGSYIRTGDPLNKYRTGKR